MAFEIVRNDIANMQVDAIVNAASRYPRVNAGVDGAVHKKAGPELLAAREKIGHIQPGSAAITPAFHLAAKYVIHATSPSWADGTQGELQCLRSAYDTCLKLAAQKGCQSIAFPLLASGNHGFPKDKALQVAIAAFSEFLMTCEMQIYLVVFDKAAFSLSGQLFQNVASFIDQHYVDLCETRNRQADLLRPRYARALQQPVCAQPMQSMAPAASLKDFIAHTDAGFSETLLKLIDKTGLKDSQIYKKANLSKQHFSKIRNDPQYRPTKPTAIALALALELDLEQTNDLIGRAGYTLTNSSKFDLIIRYFIQQKNYNIIEINIALYEFDQSTLG